MSDPQINIEIEDVLASIRRLVSEGEAPRRTAAAQPVDTPAEPDPVLVPDVRDIDEEAVANSPTAPEKLVLSPEQMVSVPDNEASESEEVAESEPSPLILMPEALTQEASQPVEMSEVEEAPSAVSEYAVAEAETEFSEAIDPVSADAPASLPAADHFDVAPQEMWHSVRSPAQTEEVSDAGERGDLLTTIAELEAAVSDASDEFEPDGSETTPVVDWAETTANGAIFGARAATTRISDVAGAEAEFAAATPEDVDVTPEPAPEDIIAEAVIDAEMDAMMSRLDDDLVKYLEAETTVDEEALREMVRGIIREELQGALGERITRNVRKLVRREIYRVMASEEFS